MWRGSELLYSPSVSLWGHRISELHSFVSSNLHAPYEGAAFETGDLEIRKSLCTVKIIQYSDSFRRRIYGYSHKP